jgi:uncharacterized protein YbaA (DUF1428 family)
MRYVDGYVLPVPKKNLAVHRRMAQKAGKVWMEHGALQFCECVGDALKTKMAVGFPTTIKLKPGETVFSRGSCSNRVPIATASTPGSRKTRDWPR